MNYSRVDTGTAGKRGVLIALNCWPHLRESRPGGPTDRAGIDAFGEPGETVQIKFDQRIAVSGNVYHELYEKTKGQPNQAWRASPHAATWYVFATDGYAWRVPVYMLAALEVGLTLTQISETSMGFLIPEPRLVNLGAEWQEHEL